MMMSSSNPTASRLFFLRSVIALLLLPLCSAEVVDSSDSGSNSNKTLIRAASADTNSGVVKISSNNGGRKLQSIQRNLSVATEATAIRNVLEIQFGTNPVMKAKFLRLGFHDCVGGCDGCVDLANPENNGLAIPIDALGPIVSTRNMLSRADIWALATVWAAETMQADGGVTTPFPFDTFGRTDCGNDIDLDVKGGPNRDMPSTEFTTHEILEFFNVNFGFTPRETVVILGAHSVGQAARENSGYDGPNGWDATNDILDNDYYHQLVGKIGKLDKAPSQGQKWKQVEIDNSDIPDIDEEVQWVRDTLGNQGGDEIFMLHADVALVRNLDDFFNDNNGFVSCEFAYVQPSKRCPMASETINLMSEYREDEQLWIEDFRDTLLKMVSNTGGDNNIFN